MTARPFRFGVNLLPGTSRADYQDKARRAEELGYDVLLIQDHLGTLAPFPALVAAAEVTTRPRLGTFVLNTGFYRPALLAREVTTTDHLIAGRLELGLGAGYVKAEMEAIGLDFPGGRARVDHLAHTVEELLRLFAGGHSPTPPRPSRPPLLLAGKGDRLLRLAARHADIVGITTSPIPGEAGQAALAERVEFLRASAGDRFADIEINLSVMIAIAGAQPPDLTLTRRFFPGLSDDELLRTPGVLYGTEEQIAETLLRYREAFGASYFAVPERCMVDFAKVISLVR